MKKTIIILSIVGLSVAALGVAGYAYAQENLPPDSPFPFGQGFMGARGGHGRGAFGQGGFIKRGLSGEEGPLHEYMLPAMAEAFDLTTDELETMHESGETLRSVFSDLTTEEINIRMSEAFEVAVAGALADGVITQEEADLILSRIGQFAEGGFGPGKGGLGRHGMRGNHGGIDMGYQGAMHDYMFPALADALGLSPEELETRQEAGETIWQIAEEQDMTLEEFRTMMSDASTLAIEGAVADELITQDQADLMLERMDEGNFRGGFRPCQGAGYGKSGWRMNDDQ